MVEGVGHKQTRAVGAQRETARRPKARRHANAVGKAAHACRSGQYRCHNKIAATNCNSTNHVVAARHVQNAAAAAAADRSRVDGNAARNEASRARHNGCCVGRRRKRDNAGIGCVAEVDCSRGVRCIRIDGNAARKEADRMGGDCNDCARE